MAFPRRSSGGKFGSRFCRLTTSVDRELADSRHPRRFRSQSVRSLNPAFSANVSNASALLMTGVCRGPVASAPASRATSAAMPQKIITASAKVIGRRAPPIGRSD
jgi:hypothetical protein